MKIYNKIVTITIGTIALYAIFLIISDFNTIINKISNFKSEFIPLILLLVTSTWFILFARWNLLLKNSKIIIPKKNSFIIFLSGFALTIIPGKVGELIKSQLLKTKFGISRTRTAPIVIMEQLYNVIGIMLASIFGIWNFELGIYIMSVFSILLIFLLVLISSKKFFLKLMFLATKIKVLSKFSEELSYSHDIIIKSTRGSIVFYASALSALFWLVESFTVYIMLGVLSFLPLGIGVVEGSLASFLTLQGIDVSIVLTLVIIIRIFTRWYSVSAGFIALKLSGGLKKDSSD